MGAGAHLLLPDAAAAPRSGADPREYRLRVGVQRHRAATLDAARHLGSGIDDPVAGLALRAGTLPSAPPHAEAAARMVSPPRMIRYWHKADDWRDFDGAHLIING